jgi:hypothetical protein
LSAKTRSWSLLFVADPAMVRGGQPAACNSDQQQWSWCRAFAQGTVWAFCCASQLLQWWPSRLQVAALSSSHSGGTHGQLEGPFRALRCLLQLCGGAWRSVSSVQPRSAAVVPVPGVIPGPRSGACCSSQLLQWWCRAKPAAGGCIQRQAQWCCCLSRPSLGVCCSSQLVRWRVEVLGWWCSPRVPPGDT